MKFAVLMTCYDRVQTTLKCLTLFKRACAKIEDAQFDVWLVDDASPDCTGEKVKLEMDGSVNVPNFDALVQEVLAVAEK